MDCRVAPTRAAEGFFLPERPPRELRELTRYRTQRVRERAAEVNRLAHLSGVTVLGAGVNPGFIMDLLPLLLTFANSTANSLHRPPANPYQHGVVRSATGRLVAQRQGGLHAAGSVPVAADGVNGGGRAIRCGVPAPRGR